MPTDSEIAQIQNRMVEVAMRGLRDREALLIYGLPGPLYLLMEEAQHRDQARELRE